MDIPEAFRWVFLGLAVLQILSLVPVLRKLRRAAPGPPRVDTTLDLLDVVSGLTLVAGLWLGDSAVILAGLVVMGLAMAAKGYRALRVRWQSDPSRRG